MAFFQFHKAFLVAVFRNIAFRKNGFVKVTVPEMVFCKKCCFSNECPVFYTNQSPKTGVFSVYAVQKRLLQNAASFPIIEAASRAEQQGDRLPPGGILRCTLDKLLKVGREGLSAEYRPL